MIDNKKSPVLNKKVTINGIIIKRMFRKSPVFFEILPEAIALI
jgi:hypothetical protein